MYNILNKSEKNINTMFFIKIISGFRLEGDYFVLNMAAHCLFIYYSFFSYVLAVEETKVGNWIYYVIPKYFSSYLLTLFFVRPRMGC